MKKLFTMVAMAFMAVCVNAQSITWSEKISAGSVPGSFSSADGGLVLTITADAEGKMAVDGNSQYFGDATNYVNYKFRFKTGATSGEKSGLKLTVPSDGTLKIAVRSASSSATDRNLVLTQTEEIYNQVVKDEDAVKATIEGKEKSVFPIITVDVKAGDIDIAYPKGSLNFYAFEFTPASNPGTAIESVKASVENNGKAYNVGGRVASKGLVIKNGKKYVK